MPANRCDITEKIGDGFCSQWSQRRALSSCKSEEKESVEFLEALSHALPLTLYALELLPGMVQGGKLWKFLLRCLFCIKLRSL